MRIASNASLQAIRITGGSLKGRVCKTPKGALPVRPAMGRMREAVFAVIGESLVGKSFLDLFSGTASIAVEAASRGAGEVCLCEKDKDKAAQILMNVKITEAVGVRVQCHFIPVELFLKRCKRSFDFVFMDPPFAYRFKEQLLEAAAGGIISQGGLLMIHHPSQERLSKTSGGLTLEDERKFGGSVVNFYRQS